MTEQQPVILLNIAETVNVLEGLSLYVLANGNDNSRKMENHESCFKFYVYTTNTVNGEKVKMKFALHGRLNTRKGVGIDHKFVVDRIIKTLADYLESKQLIITDNLAMGSTMIHAIWRHTFGAGTRVADFANGVGVFSQPQSVNFNIAKDDISKLDAINGTYTLAVANGEIVKLYLGEEPPVWGLGHDSEEELWRPNRKRVTPSIVNACLEHFVQHISSVNDDLEVFPDNKFEDLKAFVLARQAMAKPAVEETTPVVIDDQLPDNEDRPGFFSRWRSVIGMGASQQ